MKMGLLKNRMSGCCHCAAPTSDCECTSSPHRRRETGEIAIVAKAADNLHRKPRVSEAGKRGKCLEKSDLVHPITEG